MADAIEIFTNSSSERIEVITSGAQGPQGPAGPAGATFDQDLNTTDAVTFASVNAPLYDAALSQPGAGVDDAVFSIYAADGTAKLDASGMTGTRLLALPDESGTLALVANTATAAQGALAASAVQPGTDVEFGSVIAGTQYAGTKMDVSGIELRPNDSLNGTKLVFAAATTSADRTHTLPNASGTLALTSDIPTTFDASAITSGTLNNARVNWAAPSAIGGTTPAAGAFTSLSGTSLSAAAGTITASAPFDFSQTWNNAAVTFTGLKLNVTDTASNAASLFADFQIGGSPKAQFTKLGSMLVYNTYTSSTNYERGFFKWSSNVLQIGTEKGSGGGTARDLELQTDGTTKLKISSGGASVTGSISASSYVSASSFSCTTANSGISFGNGYTFISGPSTAGVLLIKGLNDTDVLLRFGGTTTSWPAIKTSGTTIKIRLADDSAFTAIQGKLTTDTNAAAGTITPDKTLTLYDAAGTAYKVPCVAA